MFGEKYLYFHDSSTPIKYDLNVVGQVNHCSSANKTMKQWFSYTMKQRNCPCEPMCVKWWKPKLFLAEENFLKKQWRCDKQITFYKAVTPARLNSFGHQLSKQFNCLTTMQLVAEPCLNFWLEHKLSHLIEIAHS